MDKIQQYSIGKKYVARYRYGLEYKTQLNFALVYVLREKIISKFLSRIQRLIRSKDQSMAGSTKNYGILGLTKEKTLMKCIW